MLSLEQRSESNQRDENQKILAFTCSINVRHLHTLIERGRVYCLMFNAWFATL